MRRRHPALLAVLILLGCCCNPLAARERTWTSVDGKSFEGVMLSVEDGTVRLQRSSDRRQFHIPVDRLSAVDQKYVRIRAAAKFVRLDAVTTKTDTDRKRRVVGTRTVRRRDANGRVWSRQVNRYQDYSLTAKTLRISPSTTSVPFDATIEILFMSRKGRTQAVFDSRSRSMRISPASQPFEVTSKKSEHYYGWAVLVKHSETGQVIASEASGYAIEQFALRRAGK